MNVTPSEETNQDVRILLLTAFDERWDSYSRQLERCRSEFSKDAVHDLRVATRRILALIRLLQWILPHPRLKKLSRRFKLQLDAFDELRDTQVILDELSKILPDLPQLEEFQKDLEAREQKLLHSLQKKIEQFETDKIASGIQKTRAVLESELPEDTHQQVLQAVDNAFLRTRERLRQIDPTNLATIHQVRVAFKSLRYMVEIAQPLIKAYPSENLKKMDKYQTLMGEVQDAEVFTETISSYKENGSTSDLEAVDRYEQRRHNEALSNYTKNMRKLFKFWRRAPDLPFPWEQSEK